MFVLKHTFEHDKFLAAGMCMGRKMAIGRIAHDRCRPRHFVSDAVEHPPLDPFHR